MAYSSDDLFKYQQLYEQEKKRIEAAQRAESARKIKESYAEKIEMAEDEIEIEEYKNEEILKLQKLSSKSYLASLKELAAQEKEILKALKLEITDIYKGVAKTAEDSIEEVLSKQEKLEKKLASHGNHNFSHINVYGGGKNGGDLSYDILNDYAKTNTELLDYYNSILAVKERISKSGFDSSASADFLSVLADMSVIEGAEFSKVLLNSSDKKFKDAISGYQENQLLTERISAELFSSEFETAVNHTADYMKTELEKLGFEIPEGFTVSGTISAEKFGASFVESLDSQLETVRNMISAFNASLSSPSYVFENSQNKSSEPSNVVYNQNFSIGTSKDSAFDQITAWKNATAQARLRGQ